MAYVGRSPRYGFLEGQTATFNGSTTVVTLQRNVSSTDAIDVFIDNVHQEPDVAYTLSSGGNSITFTGTPDNGAVLYIRFHGLAFDTARAYRLVNSDEGSSLTLGNDDTLTLSLDGTTALTATSSGITIPNLTVTGTTTSVNSTNLEIGDNKITLNSDVASDTAPTENAGIVINRGSSADVQFLWNETNDEWYAGNDLATGGIFRVKGGGTTPTLSGSTLAAFTRSAATNNASIAIIGNSGGFSSVHFGDENDEDVGQLNYSHTADTFALNKGLGVTGNITVSGTVDGVDIATRDGVLTSTTTTAGAALPKAGGTMTGDLNLGSGVALEVNGTTVIDSSRNGSFADLEFTGSLTHAWTNSGVISIGVAQRGGNIFNTAQNLLQVMGADAYIGGQAMAGGDLLLRGGFAVDNAGLSVYPGDVTIRGGVPHSGTDANGGKIYLQTGGTSANRLAIRGDGNIGVGMDGSSSAKFTIQGKAGTVGNIITDKTLHVIEGGYNDGPTFQVSNSSGVSRFQVDGDGNVGIGESSPSQPLVVKRATDGAVIVANTAQAGGQGIGFFTDTANSRVGVFNNSSTSLDMVFNTGGTATSGEAMRIDNATGIVGIRTSSIAGVADSTGVQALQLGSTHLIHYDEDAAGTSSFSNNVYWNGSQNTTVFSGKASQIYMENGNIIFRNSDDNHGVGAQVANFYERLRINSEGNVGIGNTDTDYKLSVGDTSTYNYLQIQGANSNVMGGVRFKHHGGGGRTGVAKEWIISRGSDQTQFNAGVSSSAGVGGLAFWAAETGATTVDAMRLKDDGNAIFGYKLGIAVPDPTTTLHVNGAAIIGSDDNANTTPIAGLHVLDNSYSHWSSTLSKRQVALRVETFWNAASGQRAVGTYGGGIGFNHLGGHSTTHDENLHSWIGPRVVSTPNHETSALVFATNNVTTDEDSGITEQMVILPNGNVGIGVTDPRNDLHVGGAICSLKGVSNGTSLVKVVGRGMYHILASNNYGAGSAVRHAAYYVCLDYEGDAINHTETVFTNNSMTVSFYISGGWLYCNGLPAGNNQVSVFGM